VAELIRKPGQVDSGQPVGIQAMPTPVSCGFHQYFRRMPQQYLQYGQGPLVIVFSFVTIWYLHRTQHKNQIFRSKNFHIHKMRKSTQIEATSISLCVWLSTCTPLHLALHFISKTLHEFRLREIQVLTAVSREIKGFGNVRTSRFAKR
jgi:hypothetical protein